MSCARDGSVAASHIGGGRQRLLRAAGGGPAQRCLQAVGGTALTAGDGGTSYIWDLRAMQLGGTLQVATLPLSTGSELGRLAKACLSCSSVLFCFVLNDRWRTAYPSTRCTCTARRARRAACCSASPTARWRRGALGTGSVCACTLHTHGISFTVSSYHVLRLLHGGWPKSHAVRKRMPHGYCWRRGALNFADCSLSQ